jgi:hypothetical protein
VKDHKKKNDKGEFPTCSVQPAKNVTAGFPHVGQHGIRNILNGNNIEFSKKNNHSSLRFKRET